MKQKWKATLAACLCGAVLVSGCAAAQGSGSSAQAVKSSAKPTAKVYFTKDISPAGMLKVYKAMGWTPTGKVGVKLSTGETAKTNYLRPALIKDTVDEVHGTIVECNTAYGGNREDTANHWKAIKERGYLDIAPVDILDEEGTMTLPVPKEGKHIKENIVGSHFKNYDSYLVLSHFKGHVMAGFGGALKNISIGFASTAGKLNIHTAGVSTTEWKFPEQDDFLESMAAADKTIMNAMGPNIAFVNVLNRLSIDCDCDADPAEPDIHDIGIMASLDPVALDQASYDMVAKADGNEALMNRIKERHGTHILEEAERLGVGNRQYDLVNVDE